MLEVTTTPGERHVAIALDESSCARDAVYATAFTFIDRCVVRLERAPGGRQGWLQVTLRTKRADDADLDTLAASFKEELLGQAWRQKMVDDNRALLEGLAIRAYGPAAPPDQDAGLDDLLAGADDAGAFDDPLGIAMSWEEKYAKKPNETPDEAKDKGA